MDLDILYNKAIEVANDYNEFLKILVEFKNILEFDYRLRNRRTVVVSKAVKKAIFFGDIHGDLETTYILCKKIDIISLLKNEWYAVFLGDYVDRGGQQLEALAFIAMLKTAFPSKVITIRGNHEPYKHLVPYPHDYPEQLIVRFGKPYGLELYELSRELFDFMPLALLVPGKLLAVHGGPPISRIVKYADAEEILAIENDSEALEDILWSDPIEDSSIGYIPSYRGAGKLWGPSITLEALKKLNIKLIIRGHEPVNGYRFNHNKRVLTLFSMKGYYNNLLASCLRLNVEDINDISGENFVSV